jgi:hypothetical protein
MELLHLVGGDADPDLAKGKEAPGILQAPLGETGTRRLKIMLHARYETTVWEEMD